MDCWNILQMEATSDVVAIKRAYAARLKVTRPDDDAAAYQQLRAAYETALQLSRWSLANESKVEPLEVVVNKEAQAELPAGEVVASEAQASEPVAEPAVQVAEQTLEQPVIQQVPDYEGALLLLSKEWLDEGDAWLLGKLPAIEHNLDAVPLAWRDRASHAWAVFVVENPELPDAFVSRIANHFQWGADFRSEQRMGLALAQKLRERFAVVLDPASIPPETLKRHAWHLAMARAMDVGRQWLAVLIALLMPLSIRSLLDGEATHVLRAFGHGRQRILQIRDLAGRMGAWQVAVPIVLLCYALELSSQSHARNGDAPLHWVPYFAPFVPTVLTSLLCGRFLSKLSKFFVFKPALGSKLKLLALLTPWMIGVFSFFSIPDPLAIAPDLYTLMNIGVVATYVLCLLIQWPGGQAWELAVAPTLVLMVVGFNALFPDINLITLQSAAVASVMHCSQLLKKYPIDLRNLLHAVRTQKTGVVGALRIAAFLLVGFKILALLGAVLVVVAAPYVIFKIAYNHSIGRAYFVMVSAFTLAVCVGSPDSLSYIFGWVMICNGVVLLLQYCATLIGNLVVKYA